MNKHIRQPRITDPRIAISRHIGWSKAGKEEPIFAAPQPDEYNYAICASRPKVCNHLNYQVFYKLPNDSKWWSVYLVEDDERDQFLEWLSSQDFDTYWSTRGGASLKKQMVSLF